jgi:hypothetical protein
MTSRHITTVKHLREHVHKSLKAQQAMRDRMAQVAAEAAAAKAQPPAQGAPK